MSNTPWPAGAQRINTPCRPTNPGLWQAARQFEEIFMAQFVKTMRTSSLKGGLLKDSPGRETFDQMLSESLGREMGGRYAPPPKASNEATVTHPPAATRVTNEAERNNAR